MHTIEGNRTGLGPDGETRKDGVVKCTYTLTAGDAIFAIGRMSPFDFLSIKAR